MSKALARPGQTSYPLSVVAGRDAAALWLKNPVMSPATWRDYHSSTHACGVGLNDPIERRQASDKAFAQGAVDATAGVVIITVEVSHA